MWHSHSMLWWLRWALIWDQPFSTTEWRRHWRTGTTLPRRTWSTSATQTVPHHSQAGQLLQLTACLLFTFCTNISMAAHLPGYLMQNQIVGTLKSCLLLHTIVEPMIIKNKNILRQIENRRWQFNGQVQQKLVPWHVLLALNMKSLGVPQTSHLPNDLAMGDGIIPIRYSCMFSCTGQPILDLYNLYTLENSIIATSCFSYCASYREKTTNCFSQFFWVLIYKKSFFSLPSCTPMSNFVCFDKWGWVWELNSNLKWKSVYINYC